MSNVVEALCDLLRHQMPVLWLWPRFGHHQWWMNDWSGQHRRGLYLRNESAQTNAGKCQHLWSTLCTRHISHVVLPLLLIFFRRRRIKFVEYIPFYLLFLTNIAHTLNTSKLNKLNNKLNKLNKLFGEMSSVLQPFKLYATIRSSRDAIFFNERTI